MNKTNTTAQGAIAGEGLDEATIIKLAKKAGFTFTRILSRGPELMAGNAEAHHRLLQFADLLTEQVVTRPRAEQAYDGVTRESALVAIDYVDRSNAPGRKREAIAMLSALTQQAAPEAPTDDRIKLYQPGQWFDACTVDEMQAFYLSRLPAIREAAKEHGYAIGLHGSTRRDFDLMAMRWREGASDKDTLARAIADAACGIRREGAYDWEAKPSGRVATSIPICWTAHDNPDFDNMVSAGHIDLSVIEPAPTEIVADVVLTRDAITDRLSSNVKWRNAATQQATLVAPTDPQAVYQVDLENGGCWMDIDAAEVSDWEKRKFKVRKLYASPAATTASASTDVQASFEAWAMSHGGLPLDRAGDHLETDDGLLHFPTYKFGRTEIAWRAWANRRAPAPSQEAAPVGPALRELTRAVVARLGWTINGTFVVTKSGDNLHTADAVAFVHAALAQQGAAQDQEAVFKFAIEVEKMLCAALGREWSTAGISIESLIAELKAQAAHAGAPSLQVAITICEQVLESQSRAHFTGTTKIGIESCITALGAAIAANTSLEKK
jgi:hypothetical protein